MINTSKTPLIDSYNHTNTATFEDHSLGSQINHKSGHLEVTASNEPPQMLYSPNLNNTKRTTLNEPSQRVYSPNLANTNNVYNIAPPPDSMKALFQNKGNPGNNDSFSNPMVHFCYLKKIRQLPPTNPIRQ